MKHLQRNLLVVALTACSFITAGAVQVSDKLDNLNYITVTFKLQMQGDLSDNGSVSTYARPKFSKLVTKDLLDALAADKYAQSNYTANHFPSGSKLAVTQGGAIVVVNNKNELQADVSDIIHYTSSSNSIVSGKVDNSTGLARPKRTDLVLVRLVFDDTFIAGGSDLSFSVLGVDQSQTNDSKPGNNGNYTEKTKDQVKAATGEGQSGGTPFIINGSIRGKGSAKLTLQPT